MTGRKKALLKRARVRRIRASFNNYLFQSVATAFDVPVECILAPIPEQELGRTYAIMGAVAGIGAPEDKAGQ